MYSLKEATAGKLFFVGGNPELTRHRILPRARRCRDRSAAKAPTEPRGELCRHIERAGVCKRCEGWLSSIGAPPADEQTARRHTNAAQKMHRDDWCTCKPQAEQAKRTPPCGSTPNGETLTTRLGKNRISRCGGPTDAWRKRGNWTQAGGGANMKPGYSLASSNLSCHDAGWTDVRQTPRLQTSCIILILCCFVAMFQHQANEQQHVSLTFGVAERAPLPRRGGMADARPNPRLEVPVLSILCVLCLHNKGGT